MPEGGAGLAPLSSSSKILPRRRLPCSGSESGAGGGLQKTDTPGEGSRKTEIASGPGPSLQTLQKGPGTAHGRLGTACQPRVTISMIPPVYPVPKRVVASVAGI